MSKTPRSTEITKKKYKESPELREKDKIDKAAQKLVDRKIKMERAEIELSYARKENNKEKIKKHTSTRNGCWKGRQLGDVTEDKQDRLIHARAQELLIEENKKREAATRNLQGWFRSNQPIVKAAKEAFENGGGAPIRQDLEADRAAALKRVQERYELVKNTGQTMLEFQTELFMEKARDMSVEQRQQNKIEQAARDETRIVRIRTHMERIKVDCAKRGTSSPTVAPVPVPVPVPEPGGGVMRPAPVTENVLFNPYESPSIASLQTANSKIAASQEARRKK
jgi:hypothetical protein